MKRKIILIVFLLGFFTSVFAQVSDNVNIKDTTVKKKTLIEKTIGTVADWYMENMNYGTVALLMTVESSCFIPFPSEVVVPPAAYKASQEDSGLNIILIIIFATIGAVVGSVINYCLGLWVGRPVIHKFADSRLGRFCLLSSEKVQKAENFFVKNGKSSTFIGRFVPGIRQIISLPAGLAKMPFLPFLLYTTLGAGIWNVILALLGYAAYRQKASIDEYINLYGKEISYFMLAVGVVFVMYLIYSGFIKKKKQRNEQ